MDVLSFFFFDYKYVLVNPTGGLNNAIMFLKIAPIYFLCLLEIDRLTL